MAMLTLAHPRRRDLFVESLYVIWTVARRELLVQLRYRNKFLIDWTAHILGIAPILLTAWAVSGGKESSGLKATVGTGDWLTFVVLGYIAFTAFGVGNTLLNYTGMSFALDGERALGTLERNFLTPAPREIVALGSGAYYTVLYLYHVVSLLVVSVVLLGIEVTLSIERVALAGLVLLSIVVMSIGLGMLSAGILLALRDQSLFLLFVHRPLLLLSGAYFVIPSIPEPFRSLARLNPIAYAVDAFRGSLSGTTILLPLHVEIAILVGSAIGMVILGVWLFHRLVERMLRSGALGLF